MPSFTFVNDGNIRNLSEGPEQTKKNSTLHRISSVVWIRRHHH